MQRGLDRDLALKVVDQLMARDALGTHARDELGISEISTARPLQAALASAVTFGAGAAAPLLVVPLAPRELLLPLVALVSLTCLAVLGSLGAIAGGAPLARSVLRVTFWGAFAMALTAGVGRLFGVTA